MKSRIIFVLTTLVLIFGINKFSLQKDINKLIENLNTVNVAGKQRMYSQKISKLSLFYFDDIKKMKTKNYTLDETVDLFSNTHNTLKSNLKNYNNDYLQDLFKELEPNFNSIVSNVNLLTSSNSSNLEIKSYVNKITSASNSFLSIMDAIVGQYETIGKERGETILNREFTFNIILVVLFTYSILFIIVPVIRTFDKSEKLSFF